MANHNRRQPKTLFHAKRVHSIVKTCKTTNLDTGTGHMSINIQPGKVSEVWLDMKTIISELVVNMWTMAIQIICIKMIVTCPANRIHSSNFSLGEGGMGVVALAKPHPQQICWVLRAHNWQKWKGRFLTCPCNHKIYRVEAFGLLISNYMLKNYEFWDYVKFGVISWKFDILLTTASLKFESKNPFAHVWHVLLWLSAAHHISFSFWLKLQANPLIVPLAILVEIL